MLYIYTALQILDIRGGKLGVCPPARENGLGAEVNIPLIFLADASDALYASHCSLCFG